MAALLLGALTLALLACGYVIAYVVAGVAVLFLLLQSGAGMIGPIAAGLWVLAILYVWRQNP